jgi:hypothetical protein
MTITSECNAGAAEPHHHGVLAAIDEAAVLRRTAPGTRLLYPRGVQLLRLGMGRVAGGASACSFSVKGYQPGEASYFAAGRPQLSNAVEGHLPRNSSRPPTATTGGMISSRAIWRPKLEDQSSAGSHRSIRAISRALRARSRWSSRAVLATGRVIFGILSHILYPWWEVNHNGFR